MIISVVHSILHLRMVSVSSPPLAHNSNVDRTTTTLKSPCSLRQEYALLYNLILLFWAEVYMYNKWVLHKQEERGVVKHIRYTMFDKAR